MGVKEMAVESGQERVPPVTLRNYWHPIGTVDDVTSQPRRFTLLGEHVVAYRHEDHISAFKDVCIHRGTALSGGHVTEGRITCPYHGWEYDQNGVCVRIPSLRPDQSIPRKARAIPYRAVERYGLVWLGLDEPAAPIPPWPDDAWDDPSFRCFMAYRGTWTTSAGRAVENFMDFSHFPFVHTGILGSLERTVIDPKLAPEPVETDYGLAYTYEQVDPGDLYSGLTLYEYFLYLPFTIHIRRTPVGGPPGEGITTVSLVVQPIAKMEEKVELYVFNARNHAFDVSDEAFGTLSIGVMEQDRVIVETQRPHEIPVDLREELHLKVPDASGMAYRRLLGGIEQEGVFMP